MKDLHIIKNSRFFKNKSLLNKKSKFIDKMNWTENFFIFIINSKLIKNKIKYTKEREKKKKIQIEKE